MRTITRQDLAHGPVAIVDGESFAVDQTTLPKGIELALWRYKGSTQVYLGVIAQQVQSVRPDVVGLDMNGRLTVDHSRLFGMGLESGNAVARKEGMRAAGSLRATLGL